MSTPIETERKFLIKMPHLPTLLAMDGIRVLHLEQTYLLAEDGKNARVRRIVEGNNTTYVKTVKQRINSLSCFEEEYEISLESYNEELKHRDTAKEPVVKTRYTFPHGAHIVEIDIYPFWSDRAILEVELKAEDEEISLPEFIDTVKEVTEDKRYKNTNIAKNIPFDKI